MTGCYPVGVSSNLTAFVNKRVAESGKRAGLRKRLKVIRLRHPVDVGSTGVQIPPLLYWAYSAQLVEHLPCKEKASGSRPDTSIQCCRSIIGVQEVCTLSMSVQLRPVAFIETVGKSGKSFGCNPKA